MKKFVKIYYKMDENDKIDIKIQLLKMGKTLKECANELGVSSGYLSDVLNGKRNIPLHILKQFEKIGIKLNIDEDTVKEKDNIELEEDSDIAEGFGTVNHDKVEGNYSPNDYVVEGKPTGYYDIKGRENILKGWV